MHCHHIYGMYAYDLINEWYSGLCDRRCHSDQLIMHYDPQKETTLTWNPWKNACVDLSQNLPRNYCRRNCGHRKIALQLTKLISHTTQPRTVEIEGGWHSRMSKLSNSHLPVRNRFPSPLSCDSVRVGATSRTK